MNVEKCIVLVFTDNACAMQSITGWYVGEFLLVSLGMCVAAHLVYFAYKFHLYAVE